MGLLHGGSVIEALSNQGIIRAPDSRVFVVNPSDSGFTVQDAIDECEDGKGDIILMLPGGNEVTEAVNINKSGITIMAVNRGLNSLAAGEFSSIFSAASYTDGPAAVITVPCRIIGMGFVSRDAGLLFFSGAALLIGGAAPAGAFGVHIKDCRFPKWGLDNRIGLALAGGGAVSDVLIEGCSFEGGGANFDAGIYMQGAIQNPVIRRNYFRQCTAAVQYWTFSGGGPHAIIHENFIEDGLTLDSQAVAAAPSMVSGNWGELAAGSSYDGVVGTLQGQGIQFSGNHYTE